jgi:hypothetical protein
LKPGRPHSKFELHRSPQGADAIGGLNLTLPGLVRAAAFCGGNDMDKDVLRRTLLGAIRAGQRMHLEKGNRLEMMVECVWDVWTSEGRWMSKKMRKNTVDTVRHAVSASFHEGIDEDRWYADSLSRLVVWPNLIADDSDG